MTILATWLLVVGGCDLLRAARDSTSAARRALIVAIGVLLLVFGGVLAGLSPAAWLGVGLPWLVTFLMWVLGSAAALGGPLRPRRSPVVPRAVAFAGLAGGVVLAGLGGGAGPRHPAWPDALSGTVLASWPAEAAVLTLAVAVVQVSTANVAVRLVLDSVGVPATDNEKQLKGGRVLGPMERFFVLGLGLAGQVTAAAVVVAAKGLLRFPELQRGADTGGPTDVTEYFLIGSFASWLWALAGLALVASV